MSRIVILLQISVKLLQGKAQLKWMLDLLKQYLLRPKSRLSVPNPGCIVNKAKSAFSLPLFLALVGKLFRWFYVLKQWPVYGRPVSNIYPGPAAKRRWLHWFVSLKWERFKHFLLCFMYLIVLWYTSGDEELYYITCYAIYQNILHHTIF